jgi:hypothetical protein
MHDLDTAKSSLRFTQGWAIREFGDFRELRWALTHLISPQ